MCCPIGCISARERCQRCRNARICNVWMDNGYGQKHRNIETNYRKTWKPKYIDELNYRKQRREKS